MKKTVKAVSVAMVLVLVFLFGGCGKKSKIIGTWTSTFPTPYSDFVDEKYDVEVKGDFKAVIKYHYNSDGSVTFESNADESEYEKLKEAMVDFYIEIFKQENPSLNDKDAEDIIKTYEVDGTTAEETVETAMDVLKEEIESLGKETANWTMDGDTVTVSYPDGTAEVFNYANDILTTTVDGNSYTFTKVS